MDYMTGEIASRKRRQAAPGTIERETPDSRLQDEVPREKLPDLDPRKAPPIAGDANGGGYNAQSAANERTSPGGRVTSASALSAPRELATAKARQVVDPFAGSLYRPLPSLASLGVPGAMSPLDMARASDPAQAGRDAILAGAMPAIPSYTPPVITPPVQGSPSPSPLAVPGTVTPEQLTQSATGIKDPSAPTPAVAPAGVVSPQDAARYRSSIQAQADQQANVVRRDLNSARERLRSQGAESAARRGVGSASGATGAYYRTIDQNIAEQLALRLQDIEAQRAVAMDALERDLKDRELKAAEFEQRRVQSYLDWQNRQPPSFLEKLGTGLGNLAMQQLGGLGSAYVGQTGMFRPPATLALPAAAPAATPAFAGQLGFADPLLRLAIDGQRRPF